MTFTQFLVLLGIVIILICVPIQRKALNKIAFSRSMFITFTAIIMGILINVLTMNLKGELVGSLLIALGFAMLIFMAVKSLQHMKSVKQMKSMKR